MLTWRSKLSIYFFYFFTNSFVLRTLKLDVHELEQLHQMDEEIIEMQKETEKELTAKNQELALTIATVLF